MATSKKIDCRCCQCCKPLVTDFTKIVTLKNSGLLLYIHENNLSSKWSGSNRGSIILHNTSNRDLKRFDYIAELCQYKTNCYHCKMIIQHARNLLDDMTIIRKNEIIGICEVCKRFHKTNKCKRCEYVVDKFINDKVKHYEDRQELMKTWFCKVRKFLVSFLEGNIICRHLTNVDSESKTQINTLINLLKSSSPIRDPEIEIFPTTDRKMLFTENQASDGQIIDKIMCLLKPEFINQDIAMRKTPYDSLFEKESVCICRYLMDKRFKPSLILKTPLENIAVKESIEIPNMETKMELQEKKGDPRLKITKSDLILPKTKKREAQKSKNEQLSTLPNNEKVCTLAKNTLKNLPGQSLNMKVKTSNKEIYKNTEKNKTSSNKESGLRVKKPKDAKSDKNLTEMLKVVKRNNKQPIEKAVKREPRKIIPSIDDLPYIKRPCEGNDVDIETSESFIECRSKHKLRIHEMIKGNELVEFDSQYKIIPDDSIKPLLFKTNNFIMPDANKSFVASTSFESAKGTKRKEKNIQDYSGVITYELSNREFIDKGWTKLPTTKIMRRMNIYKMKPSNCNWFSWNKDKKECFYDTGEKLAEINEHGCGKWFYKNGNVALDYHDAKAMNTNQRCVIYSSGDSDDTGKNKPVTILACFDKLGNGVIYDHCGNYRLKYNQSEGIVIDPKIGPPGRWKWHTLNDPPVLQQVFINTFVKSPSLEGSSSPVKPKMCGNDEMYAIEIKNFLNEKATKMLQEFKPFQIRMKVIKMNNYLSIRIMDQTDIYILYRCGPICLKLNIGMILISNEIIDTEVAEVSEVSTPYDQKIPRSGSLQAIHNIIGKAKKSKYKSSHYLK